MKKLIHVDDARARLHCDNPECGCILGPGLIWGPHLIGYPCPDCGSNMLTGADYAASERAYRLVAWINKWFGWLGSEVAPPGKGTSVSYRHHNGKTVIKLED